MRTKAPPQRPDAAFATALAEAPPPPAWQPPVAGTRLVPLPWPRDERTTLRDSLLALLWPDAAARAQLTPTERVQLARDVRLVVQGREGYWALVGEMSCGPQNAVSIKPYHLRERDFLLEIDPETNQPVLDPRTGGPRQLPVLEHWQPQLTDAGQPAIWVVVPGPRPRVPAELA